MRSHADGSVIIQTSSESVPSTPSRFGEVALMAAHLRQQGVLEAICEQVRFARRRFGRYEVIDFLARALRLRHQRRRYPRSLLRAPASLRLGLHGPVRARVLASTLHTQSLPSGFASPNPSRPCARSSSLICWPVRWTQRSSRVARGIDKVPSG